MNGDRVITLILNKYRTTHGKEVYLLSCFLLIAGTIGRGAVIPFSSPRNQDVSFIGMCAREIENASYGGLFVSHDARGQP